MYSASRRQSHHFSVACWEFTRKGSKPFKLSQMSWHCIFMIPSGLLFSELTAHSVPPRWVVLSTPAAGQRRSILQSLAQSPVCWIHSGIRCSSVGTGIFGCCCPACCTHTAVRALAAWCMFTACPFWSSAMLIMYKKWRNESTASARHLGVLHNCNILAETPQLGIHLDTHETYRAPQISATSIMS